MGLTQLQIHPAIGVARLGDSPDSFYLSPEKTGGMPIQCDANGNEYATPPAAPFTFKDGQSRIKRQGARFQVYAPDDQGNLIPMKKGDTIETINGTGVIQDITWTVHLANKKAVWYEFKQLQGEHGYAPTHPLRNAHITDPNFRQGLIIDPKPRKVNSKVRRQYFDRTIGTFPPTNLRPYGIDTLGEIMTDDDNRLIVLGGFGNSGCMGNTALDPRITQYANNDNWFDDTSDGPVSAILSYCLKPAWDAYQVALDSWNHSPDKSKFASPTMPRVYGMAVQDTAWVIVGYPRYAPEIVDMITMDDLVYDLSVRNFAFAPSLYGTKDFCRLDDPNDPTALQQWRNAPKRYNPDYHPDFKTEIYPILMRPFNMQWVTNFNGLQTSFDAHEPNYRGDFDMSKISIPPGHPVTLDSERTATSDQVKNPSLHHGGSSDPTNNPNSLTPNDPYGYMRRFIYQALRQPREENSYQRETGSYYNPIWGKELMPALCGDNPLDNMLVSKFLRLTDTQLFLLKQWADGKFTNVADDNTCNLQGPAPDGQQFVTNEPISRGVLGNVLGGAFCPGGEVTWIMRNPAIYSAPYRIKPNPAFIPSASLPNATPPQLSQTENLTVGLEPGDLTKRSGIPWQSDFNECSTQEIDITFEQWNDLYYPDSTNDPTIASSKVTTTLWWPSHRPMQVYQDGRQVQWATVVMPGSNGGESYPYQVSQDYDGDFLMVSAWKQFGFVRRDPTAAPGDPAFIQVEWNTQPMVVPPARPLP